VTTTIPDHVLAADHNVSVGKVELGLTLYLADAAAWAADGAARALDEFLSVAPINELNVFTGTPPRWRSIRHGDLGPVREQLRHPHWQQDRMRHLLDMRVVDDPTVPSVGFEYREIDPARLQRTGVLCVTLPRETEPEVLYQLTVRIASIAPFWSGSAGYVLRFNDHHPGSAFTWFRTLSRRWLGIDAQEPERAAWSAAERLIGSNWLTLLGRPLIDLRKVDGAPLAAAPPPLTLQPLPTGWLLKAGAQPTLGDLNRAEFPAAYAQAERLLGSALPLYDPRFAGPFLKDDLASRWRRRLTEPQGWA
jgi:hypothetical protein